jgi:hypothetical protein
MQTRYGLITWPRSPQTSVRAWSRYSARRVHLNAIGWIFLLRNFFEYEKVFEL